MIKGFAAIGITLTILLVIWAIETLRVNRPHLMARVFLGLVMIGLVALVLILGIHFARARDFGQWNMTPPDVRDWYQALMQPDNPAVSCCGEADAYWADSYEVSPGGEYIAIVTDDRPDEPLKRKHIDVGTRILIPHHKLKYDQSNPTGHGIIFLSRGDYVYCYVAPGGV